MQSETIQQILDLNRQFYQTFARAFAATRQRTQPGVARLLKLLPARGDWLDLGCGSGSTAAAWAQTPGRQGTYVGVDFSQALLEEAQRTADACPPGPYRLRFVQGDLSDTRWADALGEAQFNVACTFAVLHHIPGCALRQQALRAVHHLLEEDGTLALSVWQPQHSPRLAERVQPWETAGLQDSQVDPGDILMDWRYTLPGEPEQTGLRYVHIFTTGELQALAQETGFQVVDVFESDGQGGRLGLYQVWRKE